MTTREQDDGHHPVKSGDTDFNGALAALQRAAAKARRRAFDTTGSVPIVEEGKVVWQTEDGTLIDVPKHSKRRVSPSND